MLKRWLTVLSERTQQWLTNIFNFSSKGPEDLFRLSQAQTCKWYTDTRTCRENIHLHEIKLKKQLTASLSLGGSTRPHSYVYSNKHWMPRHSRCSPHSSKPSYPVGHQPLDFNPKAYSKVSCLQTHITLSNSTYLKLNALPRRLILETPRNVHTYSAARERRKTPQANRSEMPGLLSKECMERVIYLQQWLPSFLIMKTRTSKSLQRGLKPRQEGYSPHQSRQQGKKVANEIKLC